VTRSRNRGRLWSIGLSYFADRHYHGSYRTDMILTSYKTKLSARNLPAFDMNTRPLSREKLALQSASMLWNWSGDCSAV